MSLDVVNVPWGSKLPPLPSLGATGQAWALVPNIFPIPALTFTAMWLEQITLTPSNLSFLICNWGFKCLIHGGGGGEEVRPGDHFDAGLSYCSCAMCLLLQLSAPFLMLHCQRETSWDPSSHEGLTQSQCAVRMDWQEYRTPSAWPPRRGPGTITLQLSLSSLMAKVVKGPHFKSPGPVVGKQLVKVQGRSVSCYSFTDNTRHRYLNSTPVVAVAKCEGRWGGNTFSPQRGFSTRDSWDLGRVPLAGDSLCAVMFWCSDLTWPDSLWDWFYSW